MEGVDRSEPRPAPAPAAASASERASSGWTPTEVGDPVPELSVDDLALIDEVTHPVRGAMFRRLKTPRSAAELAELMDVPVTRLYHHLKQLEARGLIRVVATRRVAAVTERRYQVVAHSLRLDEAVIPTLPPGELARAAGSLFDNAKLGLQRAIETGRFGALDESEHSMLSFLEANVSPQRQAEFVDRLKALVEEFDDDDADGEAAAEARTDGHRFTLFVAAFPVVD